MADSVPAIAGGVLFRSGFTLAGLCAGEGVGAGTVGYVVDLRTGPERDDVPLPETLGPAMWAPVDVGDVAGFLGAHPEEGQYLALYRAMAHRGRECVAAAVATVLDGVGRGSVCVGCSLGKDRTGVVVSVLLAAVGVPREQVVDQYRAGTELALGCPTALEGYAERTGVALAEVRRRCRIGTAPIATLLTVLDDDYGGAERYLLGAGVEPAPLAEGRRRLLRSPA